MSNNQFNLFFETELNEGVRIVTLSPAFFSDDDQAHSFIVKTTREGQPVSLAGSTVLGYFIRPDNATIVLEGSVNADGHAVVTLDDACYKKKGRFQLVIRSTMDEVISTIFCGDGGVKPSSTDSFIDEENVVPSLNDLLAQIEVMEQATAAANAAADKANNAVGPTPNLSIGTVTTLPAGSMATASFTGTAEDPVLNLGIPKGVDGDGAEGLVQSVNGETGAVQVKRLISTKNDAYAALHIDENGNALFSAYRTANGRYWGLQDNPSTKEVLRHHFYNADGSYSGYGDIYSTANKPTAADIGALPITGGNASGNIGVTANSYPCFTLANASGARLGMLFVETQNGGNGNVILRTYNSLTEDSFYTYKFSPNGGIFVQSGGMGTKYEVLTTNAPIVIGETVVSGAQVSANGYVSNQTAVVTAISGYTPLVVIAMQSTSSYLQQYAMYLSGDSIVYSVRNYSSSAVTPTYYFRVLYVRS